MKVLLIALLGILLCVVTGEAAEPVVADHYAAADFGTIPSSYFPLIRSGLSIYYGHTSHGSQIITGISMLEQEEPTLYARPAIAEEDTGLGDSQWDLLTRAYLNSHPGTNVVMWSWCGQLSEWGTTEVNEYLNKMAQLEDDYPDVVFVYMTGHLDGTGPRGTLYANNEQIRSHCKANTKVLFDFADIESYDPNGRYYPRGSDACEWCTRWCRRHACPDCEDCAHSHCFNCYQKGRAFWWMMARIAGWQDPVTGNAGN